MQLLIINYLLKDLYTLLYLCGGSKPCGCKVYDGLLRKIYSLTT